MIIKHDYLKLNIQLFADGEISYKVSVDGKEAEKTINSLSKSSDGLSKKFMSFGKKMTIGVTAPLTALATAGVKYNATMESYLANLTTLLGGNQQEAQKLLDTLKEMANTTPYEATDLVKATQKMMAFGISADDSLKYLQMLGDIAMGDANKMDSLTLAFSQISASGRASMEDINQMIDQGFNPLTVIAEKTGESMADLRDRVSAGQVSFEEIAGAFQTATSEGGTFYQSMDKASQTTEGKISSLKDAFSSALGSMTEALLPFVTDAVDGFTKIANWFSSLDSDGKKIVLTLAGIAMAIGPVTAGITKLIQTGQNIKKVVNLIKKWELATKLQTVAQKALNVVTNASGFGLIVTAIMAVVAGLVLLYQKCEWFRNAVNAVFEFVIGVVQKVIDFFKNNWQTILLFILNPFAGVFKLLYDKFEGFRNFVNTIVEAIKNFFVSLFNKIVEIVKVPIEFIKNAFLVLVAIVATIAENIYNVISSVIQRILTVIGAIASWIYTNVLLPVFNFFSSVFTAIYNNIVGFINMVISVFSTIASWIYNNVLLPIFNFFSSIFNGIWNVISNVIGWIKNGFSAAADFVKTAFNNVKNFITNIFSTVANVIKAPINGIITIINKVLKGLNKIKVPDWVPGVGGKGINFPMIPKLSVGTNYVASEGLAYLHEGEAVVPKKYNPAVGGFGNYNQPIYVNVVADMDVNKFGKAFVRDIKTFSGGAKNAYNYGGGK